MASMNTRFLGCAVVLGLASVGSLVRAQGNADAAQLKNPVAATPESIAAGQQLYQRNCASCHGRNGQGGPGNDLIPAAPSLLGDAWNHGSTDGEIFTNIKEGIGPDMKMKAFKAKLSDQDIWNVVNYIHSLQAKK